MAQNTIDISTLKSGATSSNNEKEPRDFGNGLKEFDPIANGFQEEKKELIPSDKDRALAQFDENMDKRIAEVELYNELLDMHGGSITEEELREAMGQEFLTKQLHDGKGDEYEDPDIVVGEGEVSADVEQEPITTEQSQSSELSELEKELEADMEMEPTIEIPKTTEPAIKTEQSKNDIPEALSTVAAAATSSKPLVVPDVTIPDTTTSSVVGNLNIEERKEPEVDDKGLSQEDKDLAALEDDDNAPPVDDFEEKLKKELERKMRPVTKKFDLSHAVISKQPITVNNAMSNVTPIDRKTFVWALMKSKRPIVMKGFTATELNVLSSNVRNDSQSREVFKTIWEHIVQGKGKDFDTWTKCTSYFDVDHIWFAIYGACFEDSNYLPFNCPSCKELTVTNNIPVSAMCKFTKPEYKKEFEDIRKMPVEPNMGNTFQEYLVQVSDTLVVGFKDPSIYDAVIAPNMLDSEFKQKYSDIIGVNAYIGNIYYAGVDGSGQVVLQPILTKTFVNNEVKTLKAKIIQHSKILRSLPSDQYNIIIGHINTMNDVDMVYYGLPSTTCDHCKKELKEERSAAADLVFMRHQLATLGA